MAKIRILHALQTLDSGGIATIVRNLLESLPPREFEHTVVVERASCDRVGPHGTPLYTVPPCPWWRTPRRIDRMRRLLRERGIDVVHGYDWPGVDAVIAGALSPGVGLVMSEHGRPSVGPRRRPFRQRVALRWIGSRLAHAYAVAPDLAHELATFLGWPKEAVPVVVNGVDTARMRPARSGERSEPATFRFGMAGHLRPVKRPDRLLKMVRSLVASGIDRSFHVSIAGDGPLLPQLRAAVREDRLERWVSLPGMVEDMPAWYRSLDTLLVPSDYEGCSMVILEAMASGLPVIATDSGLSRELLADGAAGILVTRGNVEELTDAARRLIQDGALARRLGVDARERAQKLYSTTVRQPADIRMYRHAVERARQRKRSNK